jgi:hypothetical protein
MSDQARLTLGWLRPSVDVPRSVQITIEFEVPTVVPVASSAAFVDRKYSVPR